MTLDFAAQAIKTTSNPSYLTFTNTSTTPLTLSSIVLAPSNIGFVIGYVGADCTTAPLRANSGQCQLYAKFAPTTAGAKSATVTFTDSNNKTYVSYLNGYATPSSDHISPSPDGLDFAPQPLLSPSVAQRMTLNNSTGAPVTLGKATVTNSAFTVTTDTCSNQTLLREERKAVPSPSN